MEYRLVKKQWDSYTNGTPRVNVLFKDKRGRDQGLFRCWTGSGKIITHRFFHNDLAEGVGEYYDEDYHVLDKIDTSKKDIVHGVFVLLFYDFQALDYGDDD